jgi:hypothetical protein
LTFQRLTSGISEIAVFGDPATNPDHGLFYLGTVLPIEALIVAPVPEPSTLAMLAAATLALCVLRRSLLSR